MSGRIAKQRDDGRIELALFGQAFMQFAKLLASGQLAEPQQVAGLLEVRVVGELVDVDAAIREHTAIAVDEADSGVGGNNALKTLGSMSCGHAGHSVLS